MARSVQVPAFFQVLVDDFAKKLKIPTAFAENFNGPALCKLQGPSGKCWDVELEGGDDDFSFRKGWRKFVKDNHLDEGDFLVFNYDGNSRFDVIIYDETACEMNLEVAMTKRGGNIAGGSSTNVTMTILGNIPVIEFRSKNSCFQLTFTRSWCYQLIIPKKIVIAEGLRGTKIVKLQDSTNKSRSAKLHLMKNRRISMNKGWNDYCRANQIEIGDKIVCEFVEKHVMKVHNFGANPCIVVLIGPKAVGP